MSENSIELTKQQGLTKFLRLKKSTSQHASVFRFPGSCKQQRIDKRPSKRRIRHARTDSPAVEASPRDLNLGSKSPKLRRGGKGEGDPTGLDDGAALLALLAALLGLALVLADDRDTGQPLRHLFFRRRRGEGSEEEGVVEPKA